MAEKEKSRVMEELSKNTKGKVNENLCGKIRTLIITGGSIDYDWAADWLKDRKYDYVIAADRGLEHAKRLGIKVDYILGDYDSVNPGTLKMYSESTETVTYPSEKDFTDTHLAVLRAISSGADRGYGKPPRPHHDEYICHEVGA